MISRKKQSFALKFVMMVGDCLLITNRVSGCSPCGNGLLSWEAFARLSQQSGKGFVLRPFFR
jgi:hypothetical protein